MTDDRDYELIDAITRHVRRLNAVVTADGLSREGMAAAGRELTALDREIASLPAKGPRGLYAKARWLSQPENYNEGDFEGGNDAVLRSLLSDVMRLCDQSQPRLSSWLSRSVSAPQEVLEYAG